jgi:hypothetical protein
MEKILNSPIQIIHKMEIKAIENPGKSILSKHQKLGI